VIGKEIVMLREAIILTIAPAGIPAPTTFCPTTILAAEVTGITYPVVVPSVAVAGVVPTLATGRKFFLNALGKYIIKNLRGYKKNIYLFVYNII